MRKIAFYITSALLALGTLGCNPIEEENNGKQEKPDTETPGNNENNGSNDNQEEVDQTDWQKVANLSSSTLLDYYWNKNKNFFNYYPSKDDTPAEDWHYWPQAHAMDVIIDAYVRTGDEKWKNYFSLWHEGVKQKSGNSYFNDFVDDMEWICLTMLRLYENTNEQKYMDTAVSLWNKIKANWNTQAGGGVAWKQSQQWSKNSCSNGPAGIIAARMYWLNGQKQEDLQWAEKIYNWQSEVLVDIQSGAVYDNINAQTGEIQKNWIFTYNQGTYMGMAHELYRMTGQDYYLTMANKAANYCITKLIDQNNNVLKDEGNRDGGLFKGIFIRYFVKLIMEEDLKESDRQKYIDFFNNNAKVLHEKGTGDGNLYSTSWAKPGNWDNDMPTQVSGCTMIEAKAWYEKVKAAE